jgi:hypothetical protein
VMEAEGSREPTPGLCAQYQEGGGSASSF